MENSRKRNKRFPRGLETVEAALLLPIVLLVTFGALKYGWLFLKSQQITSAARHLVRVAVLDGDTSARVNTAFTELMEKANIEGATWGSDPADSLDRPAGEKITIWVEVPMAKVDILPLPWFASSEGRKLYASVSMSKEGP